MNFYAYLHGVVDEKVGRLLRALGDAGDPRSLRSRTVIARISDHGEMGLSHGGLRQKMFNAYEETIRVPLVFSNPFLFPEAVRSDAAASLVDLVPTLLSIAGAEPRAPSTASTRRACWLRRPGPTATRSTPPASTSAACSTPAAAASAREHVLFTFDDHQAGTARQEVPGQPNRVRCVRAGRFKYAAYLDPHRRAGPEHELYDLDADPIEARNLLERDSARPRSSSAARELPLLREMLWSRTQDRHGDPRPLSAGRLPGPVSATQGPTATRAIVVIDW